MTIGDAVAINTLLAYLRDGLPFDRAPDARDAAIKLAERAYRALRSGINGPDVSSFWGFGGLGAPTAAPRDAEPCASQRLASVEVHDNER